ncbi:hypothetical protein [Moraxella sp. ZY210820]|uniref:hypothetical protein n=1 Tax=unclassified Moraxella TaxID=2685852 RepID=UPI00272FC9A6|nr:hypothetical protein [Moraxella sp. ZY210820]WLF84116.1 hypothetical protein LU301_00980 [Moraxella sp. ZY210820]
MNNLKEKTYPPKNSSHLTLVIIAIFVVYEIYHFMVHGKLNNIAMPLLAITFFIMYYRQSLSYIVTETGIYSKFLCFAPQLKIAYDDIKEIALVNETRHAKLINIQHLWITSKQFTSLRIELNYLKDSEQFIEDIRQYIDVEEKIFDSYGSKPVGYMPVYILMVSLFLIPITLCFDHFMIQAWHTSSEYMFTWFLIGIILTTIVCYFVCKQDEKNKAVVISSITVGIFAGTMVTYFALSIQRYINEQRNIAPQSVVMELVEQKERYQKWKIVSENAKQFRFQDGYFLVHQDWKQGYNPNLEQGKNYQVEIYQSEWNDIYFKPNTFFDAKAH